ncbi:MAG: hypothetical protein ACFE8M_02760 [Candidatus Hermodarchaeota archaeon]
MSSESLSNHIFKGKLKDFEQELVEFFSDLTEEDPKGNAYTDIAAYLFIHRNLTQKQLKELTGFSVGSISNILSILENTGVIEKKPVLLTHKKKKVRVNTYSLGNNRDLFLKSQGSRLANASLAHQFILSKKKELEEFKNQNKKGYQLLLSRIEEILKFLENVSRIVKYFTEPYLKE